jgi:predicted ATPase
LDRFVVISGCSGGGKSTLLAELGQSHHYHHRVFVAPPWPEIYVTDRERRHGLDRALAEYYRLLEVFPSFDYEVSILPKTGVTERADFVLRALMART